MLRNCTNTNLSDHSTTLTSNYKSNASMATRHCNLFDGALTRNGRETHNVIWDHKNKSAALFICRISSTPLKEYVFFSFYLFINLPINTRVNHFSLYSKYYILYFLIYSIFSILRHYHTEFVRVLLIFTYIQSLNHYFIWEIHFQNDEQFKNLNSE